MNATSGCTAARMGIRTTPVGLASVLLWAGVLGGVACDRDQPAPPASTPDAGTASSGGSADEQTPPIAPAGVDDQDDPAAPRALPRTGDLIGWVKTAPVRVADESAVASLLDEETVQQVLAGFRVKRLAACRYAWGRATADVQFVEAASSEDAFGVFGVLTGRQERHFLADGSVRSILTGADARVMIGWQGVTCIRIRATGDSDDDARQACDQLLDRILFNIPSAEPPLLLQVIPTDRRARSRVWLVRTASSLTLTDVQLAEGFDPAAMDERLGLSGEPILSLATVHVGEDEADNLVWLVHYPDAGSAQAAHDRYRQALAAPTLPIDRNTLILEPRGPILAGSWTADQESIQNMLPVLRDQLPETP